MFVKLGVRYVAVVDDRGLYLGIIEKHRYLAYLQWLEKRARSSDFAGFPSMTGTRSRQEAQIEEEETDENGLLRRRRPGVEA